jgi:beta-glucanase (GH16 family)
MKRDTRLICLAAALLSAFLVPESIADTTDPQAYSWNLQYVGAVLDLTSYDLTFSDEFNADSVTPDEGAGPWYAPVHANFGSKFDTPGPSNQTYTVSNGVLTIRATKHSDGWHGGNIQTVNHTGKGFAQKYGYFEARMKFPNMPGAYPGFWLKSQETGGIVRPEIDVVEWYGGDPKGLHSSVHLWPPYAQYIKPGGLTKHWFKSNYSGEPGLAGEWHTYGAMITTQFVIFYLDRKEVARFPTLDEYKLALYPLVTLTLYDQDASKAVSPFDLQVDYVRVYSPKTPNPPSSVEAR